MKRTLQRVIKHVEVRWRGVGAHQEAYALLMEPSASCSMTTTLVLSLFMGQLERRRMATTARPQRIICQPRRGRGNGPLSSSLPRDVSSRLPLQLPLRLNTTMISKPTHPHDCPQRSNRQHHYSPNTVMSEHNEGMRIIVQALQQLILLHQEQVSHAKAAMPRAHACEREQSHQHMAAAALPALRCSFLSSMRNIAWKQRPQLLLRRTALP